MKGLGSTRTRIAVGVILAVLLAVVFPVLRPIVALAGLAGIVAFGYREWSNNLDKWGERLSSPPERWSDRLEIHYDGDLLEPEWPVRVEVDGAARKVTVERRAGVALKPSTRTIAFEAIEYLRYEGRSQGSSLALMLAGDERVPLAKIEQQVGQRRPKRVVLREPGSPDLVFNSMMDDQSRYLARRLRTLLGVGLTRPLPEDLGFAEPRPTCQSCGRRAAPHQDHCQYCGGGLATRSHPGGPTTEPTVYEIS